MDVGAFVQENKRWLLGCGVGAVGWLVVSMVFDRVHAATLPTERSQGAPTGPVYTQAALDAARAEGEELAKARAALQQAMAFRGSAKFQLDGASRPGDQLFQASRDLKQQILTAANQRDVQVAEGGLAWEIPTGVDEISATLFGLELVDELQRRLFASHDAVRSAGEEAMGLRALLGVKIEARRGQRNPARSLRQGEVDLREHFTQEQVAFQFQSDEPTALAFLEACRQPGRTLVVESWTMLKPTRPGEPCAIKGVLSGIAVKSKSAEGGEGGR
ncbi:MAG: hypothetical protein ACK595_21510 [Planctomycetota bacterium]|jgi:hypothetical protein